MQKYKIISLTLVILWSCAGSNATTMEYRSATTAVRSERNFDKGEKYALQALDMEVHANDARVAYFLAVEIYRPRKNWNAMNNMLNLAMQKNSSQLLEKPFRLENGDIIQTIADAVPIYKEEIWMNAFNQTVELIGAQQFEEALKKINFSKSVLKKVDNYVTGCLLYVQMGEMENAKKDLNQAIALDPNNPKVLQLLGDLEQQGPEPNLEKAKTYYQQALKNADDKSELMQNLIYLYVEMNDYNQAIALSEELLANNPDNADIYFNVGVIYQRLGANFYHQVETTYKNLIKEESPSEESIQSAYDNCEKTLEMVQLALQYFRDASMLEIDEANTSETELAIDEMKRLRKNIKNLYMESIAQIAKANKIILN